MAAIRPTLKAIIDRIDADAQARLSASELRRSDYLAYRRVLAGVSHELYSAIEYARRQLFSDSAETEFLERIASVLGITRRQATRAEGTAQFTWERITDIPAGTLLQTSAGVQYYTSGSPDAEGNVSIRASVAGSASNIAESGTELSLVSAVAGVTRAVTTSAIAGGADAETDAALRARVLERTRKPPRQGTKEDYIAWAQEVSGVGSVWVFPKEQGDGSVTIRFLTDDSEFPDTELIEKVKRHVESKCSVLATLYVVSPVAQKFDLTLKIKPDTAAVRARALTKLKALFLEEAVPGGTIYLSHIHAALSAVTGETDHTIVSPEEDLAASDTAHLPVLGEVTWQS